jgi:hypothetical protein
MGLVTGSEAPEAIEFAAGSASEPFVVLVHEALPMVQSMTATAAITNNDLL